MKATRTHRRLWLLPPLLLSIAVAASVMAFPHLPDRMPVHWDINGEPTGLARKNFAVGVLPGIMLWAGSLVGLILWSTTRRSDSRTPAWVPPVGTALTVGMLLIMHLASIASGLGWPVSVPFVTDVGLGLLFIGLGWMIQRIPPNGAVGVHTPRTRSDPAASARATRAIGRGLIVAGVLTSLAAPLPGAWPTVVMLISLLGACVVAVRASRGAT